VPSFQALAAELRRARDAGKADHISLGTRGLPVAVVFSSALPTAERHRKRLLIALAAFVLFWAMGFIVILLFGPHHQ
jgi:hypothetical protein